MENTLIEKDSEKNNALFSLEKKICELHITPNIGSEHIKCEPPNEKDSEKDSK